MSVEHEAKVLVAQMWNYSLENVEQMLQQEIDVAIAASAAAAADATASAADAPTGSTAPPLSANASVDDVVGRVSLRDMGEPLNLSQWLLPSELFLPRPRRRDAAVGAGGAPAALAPPRHTLPVLVLCYNRPAYLKHTLDKLFANIDNDTLHPVVVSQDGVNAAVAAVARHFPLRAHIQRAHRPLPTQLSKGPGPQYYHIAAHYYFALSYLFREHPEWDAVIVLEEDIEIAPDFFDYFQATYPLLRADASLMAISAWNDNGDAGYANDPVRVYRTSFFPGLGTHVRPAPSSTARVAT